MTLPGSATLSTYGGAKQDYLAGVTDELTDRGAAEANQAYADIAGATHTIGRAYVRFRLNAAADPTLLLHDAVWGNAPGVAPVLDWVSTGRIKITWPQTVTDELGVEHTVAFRDGWASKRSVSATKVHPTVVPLTNGYEFEIYFHTSGDALNDGSTLEVALIAL
jgi:hypothetical protein